ncbi:hypothetical protein ScPMuIL_004960 [Solemya velum]
MTEIQNDTPSSDSTGLFLQNLGYDTDGDEDLHCCGKCKLFFSNLQDYLEHKVKHDKCKVKYTRSKHRRLIIPNIIEKEEPEVADLSKVKSEPHEEQDEEKENSTRKRKRGRRKKVAEVDQELVITEKAVYICTKCDRKFNREATLKRHTEIDHNSDNDDSEDEEERVEVNDDDIKDEDFVRYNYKRVKFNAEEKGERPYTCEICGNKFREINVLRNHLLTHSNVREYCCTFEGCTYAFKTKGSLKRHMRRHTGERPYPCELCGRCFTEAGALTRHMKARKACTSKSDSDFPRYGKKVDLTTNMPVYDNTLVSVPEIPDQQATRDVEIAAESIITVSMDDNQMEGAQLEPGEVITEGEEGGLDGVIEGVTIDFTDSILEEDYAILAPTQCRVCREDFQSVDGLRAHLRIHLADTPFRCGLCHFVTEKRDLLAQHMLAQHQAQLKGSGGNVELSATGQVTSQEHQVRNAQIAVKQLLDLPLHPQEFEPEIQGPKVFYKCPVCLRSFSGSSYLRVHMRSHTGDRPFKCPHCEKSFVSRDTLEKHVYVHTDDRQFKCGECGKLFKRIAHVREHLKTHSCDRPFPCTLCDKAFKTTNALKVHLRTHSNVLPYECQFCHRHFRERGSLLRHERMHTGERPYKCKHCDKTFAEHGTLNRHLKAKVPCTRQLQQAREDEQKEEEEYPTVLAEFSSVVADTQQYILPEEEETVLQDSEQPVEYVVVETDSFDSEGIQNVEIITEGEVDSSLLETIGVSGDSEAYVVISQDGESMQIVDPKTGEVIATMPVTTVNNEETNTQTVTVIPVSSPGGIEHIETVAMAPGGATDTIEQTVVDPNVQIENLDTVINMQIENNIEAISMPRVHSTYSLAEAIVSSCAAEGAESLMDKPGAELVSSELQ